MLFLTVAAAVAAPTPKQAKQLEKWADRCALRDGSACQELAMHRGEYFGRGDPDLVLTPAVTACGLGWRESCVLVARWAESTEASPLPAWDERCDAGDTAACAGAGQFRVLTGKPDELGRATTQLATACDGGEAPACRVLGALQLQGDGIVRDEAAGLAHLEAACRDDDGWACARLDDRARYALGDSTAAKPWRDLALAKSPAANPIPLPGTGGPPVFPDGAAQGVCSVRVKLTSDAKVRWVYPVDCDRRLLAPVREALAAWVYSAPPSPDTVFDPRWVFLGPGRVFLVEGP